MANTKSKIEWTQSTWNPITGCTKVSPGCKYCYAERMAKRLQAMGKPAYQNGFQVTIHEDIFDYPIHLKTPRLIFVNSMSDLFHEEVPDDIIFRLFDVMNRASWHTFQVLTKRSERLSQISPFVEWTNNIWAGVSVENADYLYRIDALRSTNAKIKFLSLEPLLGPLLNIDLTGIDWVIVGGESGPGSRKMESDWVVNIRDTCLRQNVPFFFKQWGGTNKKKNGRLLEDRTWDELPKVLSNLTI
ncbi:MAG: phage Gp37/Gp68 family protein [Caldisericales bacterium]|jgi:protein gp37|nr:phage Gp37/Gp68 family protein [Caldisericales bacterium]